MRGKQASKLLLDDPLQSLQPMLVVLPRAALHNLAEDSSGGHLNIFSIQKLFNERCMNGETKTKR